MFNEAANILNKLNRGFFASFNSFKTDVIFHKK